MNGLLASLLATSSSEFNPTYTLAFETGQLQYNDDDWSLVESWQTSTVGLRFGYSLSQRLEIVSSYQFNEASRYVGGYYEDYYDGYYYDQEVLTMVTENQLTVGPRINFPVLKWMVPYATTQALFLANRLQMGDSLDSDNATTYFQDTAFGAGLIGALGIEFKTRPISGKFQPTMYFEGGSGISTNLDFSIPDIGVDGASMPIGDLSYGGGYFRFGIGSRF